MITKKREANETITKNNSVQEMKRFTLYILALSIVSMLSAQTYSGVVVEKNGGKPISGVNVSLVASSGLLVA